MTTPYRIWNEEENRFNPANSGVGIVQTVDFELTDAEIQALFSSPKTLVASPGVGFAVIPLSLNIVVDTAGGAYTTGGHRVTLQLAGGSALVTLLDADFTSGAVEAEYNTIQWAAEDVTAIDNLALTLTNGTADYTDGDPANVAQGRLTYVVVPSAIQ